MDDQTFDETTARHWIRTIESRATAVREQDLYPLLNAWIEVASPRRMLEIGCGQGDCSARVNLQGRSYIGVDPSQFLIERAKELHGSEERRFITGNAYKLPFAVSEFDGVFSVMVWHLLRDIRTAAREMSRVLRPGGHFLIVTANPDASAEWADLYHGPKMEGRRLEGDMQVDGEILVHDVLYLHTFDEMVAALGLAKFEVASIVQFRRSKQGQGHEYLISIAGTIPV